jgi:hypothetical protein
MSSPELERAPEPVERVNGPLASATLPLHPGPHAAARPPRMNVARFGLIGFAALAACRATPNEPADVGGPSDPAASAGAPADNAAPALAATEPSSGRNDADARETPREPTAESSAAPIGPTAPAASGETDPLRPRAPGPRRSRGDRRPTRGGDPSDRGRRFRDRARPARGADRRLAPSGRRPPARRGPSARSGRAARGRPPRSARSSGHAAAVRGSELASGPTAR